jgi:hypothetical protein
MDQATAMDMIAFFDSLSVAGVAEDGSGQTASRFPHRIPVFVRSTNTAHGKHSSRQATHGGLT